MLGAATKCASLAVLTAYLIDPLAAVKTDLSPI